MPEFEYKYVQYGLDDLLIRVLKACGNMEKSEGSKNHSYFTGVYHGHLSAYSSMVEYWTKIITAKGGD